MLSFWASANICSVDPSCFKTHSIALHSLNGVLAFGTVFLLASMLGYGSRTARLMAFFCAAAWTVHPYHVTTVLYAVQRMTILAGTFSLLAIYLLLRSLDQKRSNTVRFALTATSVLVCAPLATLSKENGVLTIFILAAIIGTLPQPNDQAFRIQRAFVLGSAAFVTAAAILAIPALSLLSGYHYRDFDIWQRLMTESRVMWHYVANIIAPSTHEISIFHDDWVISDSLLSPPTTLLAFVGWLAIVSALPFLYRFNRLAGLGVTMFLVGHMAESTILPLEIAYDHRNYLPSLGLILALTALGTHVVARQQSASVAWFGATAWIGALAGATWVLAERWSDPVALARVEAINHPASARAHLHAAHSLFGAAASSTDAAQKFILSADAARHLRQSISLSHDSPAPLIMLATIYLQGSNPLPEQDRELLLTLARSSLIDATTIGGIQALARCIADGACRTDPIVPEFLQEILKNDTLRPSYTAHVSTALGVLLAEHYGQPEAGLEYLLSGVSHGNQDPDSVIYALKLALELDNRCAAARILNYARRHYPETLHRIQISQAADEFLAASAEDDSCATLK